MRVARGGLSKAGVGEVAAGRRALAVAANAPMGYLKRCWLVWEVRRVADALGLEKVAALVRGNDLQAGADGEPQARNERIPEASVVDVLGARGEEEFTTELVAGEEAFEHREIYIGSGANLCRCGGALGVGRRLNEAPEEPAAEPAKMDVLDGRIGLVLQRGAKRREIRVRRGAEMIEALADAPGGRSGLPVELLLGQAGEELLGRFVVRVEGRGETKRPRGCG